MGNRLAVSYKIKHLFAIKPSNFSPRYKRNENISPQKNVYLTIYSSFICNGHNLETTQILIKLWYM